MLKLIIRLGLLLLVSGTAPVRAQVGDPDKLRPALVPEVAETPSPIPFATSTPLPGPISQALQVMIWELEMAQSSYGLAKNTKSLSALVEAHEKIVDSTCLTHLSTTAERYSSSPQAKICREHIDQTLALDPDSPSAICARDGIDAPSCLAAFSRQETRAFERAGEADLDAKLLSTSIEKEFADLQRELYPLERSAKAGDADARDEAKGILKQMLDISCKHSRLRLYGSDELKKLTSYPTPTPLGRARSTPDPVFDQILKFDKDLKLPPTATPNVSLEVGHYARVRFLTDKCLKTIDRALQLDVRFPAALCYRFGKLSPECVKAKDAPRKKGLGNLGTEDNSGVVEF